MEPHRSPHRIFYFCPDFPQPSGGTRTLYRQVHRLHHAGLDAAIVHQRRGFVLDWHAYPAPVIWLEDRPRFGENDILVFPEVMGDMIRQTKGYAGQRIVIALSWLPSYSRLQPAERWQDHGITRAITSSPQIQRHLLWSQEIDVTLVPISIDETLYAYRPDDKELQVAYMTRKDTSGEWLRGVLTRKKSKFGAFEWLPLRKMDENTYARHLRSSSIYLATTMQEGVNVSVLEAMACGCLVVGYSGIGGADYMIGAGPDQNCVMIENGNLLRLGQTLEQLLGDFLDNSSRFDQIIANALTTAQRYQNAVAETEALLAFFSTLQVT